MIYRIVLSLALLGAPCVAQTVEDLTGVVARQAAAEYGEESLWSGTLEMFRTKEQGEMVAAHFDKEIAGLSKEDLNYAVKKSNLENQKAAVLAIPEHSVQTGKYHVYLFSPTRWRIEREGDPKFASTLTTYISDGEGTILDIGMGTIEVGNDPKEIFGEELRCFLAVQAQFRLEKPEGPISLVETPAGAKGLVFNSENGRWKSRLEFNADGSEAVKLQTLDGVGRSMMDIEKIDGTHMKITMLNPNNGRVMHISTWTLLSKVPAPKDSAPFLHYKAVPGLRVQMNYGDGTSESFSSDTIVGQRVVWKEKPGKAE